MLDLVHHYLNSLLRLVSGFQLQHWVGVFLVAVLVGAFCLRGFGSRKSY